VVAQPSRTAPQRGRLALLFGGSALVTLSYAFCLVYCVEAFGGGLAVVAILAAYLVGSAIGQIAPTPGGRARSRRR
jgi:glycosyltransferase 2 family protein